MKGLTHIRIRCNISQSFLAQKLGVTRQAVNLWENGDAPPPPKRLRQLSEFFGIDERFFGELTEDMRRAIDATDAYQHEEDGHTYYCYTVHADRCTNPDVPFLLAPPEGIPYVDRMGQYVMNKGGAPLVSIDERYQTARQELRELLSRIDELTETALHPMSAGDRLWGTNRVLLTFSPLADALHSILTNEALSPRHRTIQANLLMETATAAALAHGAIAPDALPEEAEFTPFGSPDSTCMNPAFIRRLAALMAEEMERRKAVGDE